MSTTDSGPDHDSNTLLGLGSSDGLGLVPERDHDPSAADDLQTAPRA
jgi:hypothetical protein